MATKEEAKKNMKIGKTKKYLTKNSEIILAPETIELLNDIKESKLKC